ncbi:transposase [Xanthobacter dioxanivorans]|uniref:Transposase n=1 Tax=Xanthobacter dioxanivorans TaxID=2528964 RepID=A0A974PUF6_9HYPH|nr:transposase [Xanthobacter dioxanivorans]
MQSDARALPWACRRQYPRVGHVRLHDPSRKPGLNLEVGCGAHARRKFLELADPNRAPMAAATVKVIDAIFEIECEINGRPRSSRRP